jgi:hypothetical protein
MNPPFRAKSPHHHEMVIKGSGFGHVLDRPFVEDSISPNTQRDRKMTYDEQKQDLDPTIIILALGYASALLVIIGWVATL